MQLIVEDFPFTSIPKIDFQTGKVLALTDRAYIRMLLLHNHKISKTPVACLVDSGADINLFPASWGESIGIKIRSGEKNIIRGIGSSQVTTFSHSVQLFIADSKINFSTTAEFSYEHSVPLLGRKGFFDHFQKIIFDETKNNLRLEFKK